MSHISWKAIGLLLPLAFILNCCTQVNFSQPDNSGSPGISSVTTTTSPGGGGSTAIVCHPALNGGSSSLTLTIGSSSNPTLDAFCTPASVNYVWTITRSGTPVTINGLSGASSTPDFLGAGSGTYSIGLTATAVGFTTFTLGTPLTVVVNPASPGLPNVNCNPTLNGSLTSFTLAGANPIVAANCTPAGVGYSWTVTNGGLPVTVAGLTGSTSTPDFLSMASGTYNIYLSATMTGYNPYTSPSPLVVTVPPAATRPVSDTITVNNNSKLDILVVVDNSGSMLSDNQKLAARLKGFVDGLGSTDWQMCVTVTMAQQISSSDPNYYWGASDYWSGNPNSPAYILKSGTANLDTIFMNTINQIGAGWAGSDDERGIKAAWWHLWNGDPRYAGSSGCYRNGAALAVIVISDEDERSVGGDQSQVYYTSEANLPLDSDDLPATYVQAVQDTFGAGKQVTFNSIIVRPSDTICMADEDGTGSKSHYGVHYNQLSQLTNGHVGSICDTDYSPNLSFIRTSIQQSQASITLQCTPVGGAITDTINPSFTTVATLINNTLNFSPSVPYGSTVQLNYVCPH